MKRRPWNSTRGSTSPLEGRELVRLQAGLSALFLALLCSESWADVAYRRLPGSRIPIKVIGATDGVVASASPTGGGEAFELEILRPYYVVAATESRFQIVGGKADDPTLGWVERLDVLLWTTRQALALEPAGLILGATPSIHAWADRARLERFAATADNRRFGPSYQLNLERRALPERIRAFPVIDRFEAETVEGSPRAAFKVLLPARIGPPPGEALDPLLARDESRPLNIVLDATASMSDYAETIAVALDRLFSSIPELESTVEVGVVLFRDHVDEAPYEILQPTDWERASGFLLSAASRMRGGGDPAEPLLDALFIATSELRWVAPRADARPLLMVFANTDVKRRTIALSETVPAGLTLDQLSRHLAAQEITVVAVQAGVADGGLLAATLSGLAVGTEGRFHTSGELDHATVPTLVGSLRESLSELWSLAGPDVKEASLAHDPAGETAVSLVVIDDDLRRRLRAVAGRTSSAESILVREAWVFGRSDLLVEGSFVDRHGLERLIELLGTLADSSVAVDVLEMRLRRYLEHVSPPRSDPNAEMQALVEDYLGLRFRTDLLALSVPALVAMVDEERLQLQSRVREAATRLKTFLAESKAELASRYEVWVPATALP